MPPGRPRKAQASGHHWYESGESHQQTVALLRAELEGLSPKKREEKLADVQRALTNTKRPDSALVQIAIEVYGIKR